MTEPEESWRNELAGLSFEEAYRRLEETVDRLEQGELSLSESELLYWQGMELAQQCQRLLTEAELRITQVGESRDLPPGSGGTPSEDGDDDGEWDLPPPLEPDDPSLFDDDGPF